VEVRESSARYLARPRYKQTEVGMIPEDWCVFALGDIGKFKNGLNKDSTAFGHGSPFVNLMDVFGVNSISTAEQLGLVACSNYERASYDLRRGDVIFVRSSVKPSGIGLTAVVESDLPKTVFSGFLIRFRDGGFIDVGYKKYCFYESRFRKAVIDSSSVSANTNISQDSLKRLTFPLPPTKAEQEAIAEALSDADALIESLEQLLAKKRKIKQGAMQELLTGKKRLPGFSGEWEVRALGQIAPLQRGFDLPNDKLQRGPFPVVYSNGVLTYHVAFQVKGPGVVTGRSGTIGNVTFVEQDFWPHNTALWVTSFKGNDPRFVFYLFIQVGLERFATGSGVPTLNRNDVHAFSVRIPATRGEQAAITAILADMDVEINSLEAKLVKARQLKQGMMQDLLTGRIRLV
jgi:type I restriction enzyme, S subunit